MHLVYVKHLCASLRGFTILKVKIVWVGHKVNSQISTQLNSFVYIWWFFCQCIKIANKNSVHPLVTARRI